ncbi:restriction endonuclease subunit S [Mesobacillus foraminis]|uniref:restriction endonuclease subunit S n=1 Tax=Mesobacillus foraminis TaxID=279826 RepID=UPI001BE97CE7|nr:restriction endonuclease subunit S [Mesobacillus foraminis]MBT2757872.1 restriction endonuclease subunit S [Mesobacillus foraminis]
MALKSYKIGTLVELYNENCNIPNLTIYDVSGVNRDKEFFEPSKQVGADTSKYKIVPPYYFACNLMHVGRDEVLPIALNHTENNKFVSPAYTVFRIKDETILLREYFFMMLKSDERDRYFWFHTDSSVRDGMSLEDFYDLDIEIPPLPIQHKYVDVYNAMLANQQSYERGLEDLKLVCEGYIEDLQRKMQSQPIGPYIATSEQRNDLGLTLEAVRGIATSKEMIQTKADMDGVSLNNYKSVPPRYMAYVPDTSRRGDKISLGFNNSEETYLVSTISVVFSTNVEKLLPEYLMLFFTRSEFDRYARFNSWGSARETFNWEDMCDVKIPIPDIKVQHAIADIYTAYTTRKEINEKLKVQLKDLCPVLIKGSLEEAKRLTVQEMELV